MEATEALAYLGISKASEVKRKEQELLFQAKQFFVKQPIIRQVFERKISNLMIQFNALQVLQPMSVLPTDITVKKLVRKNTLLDQFNEFQSLKSQINGLIYSARNIAELISFVEMLLNVFDEYIETVDWPFEEELNVVLGKEQDTMELLVALKELSSKGIHSMEQLVENKNECPLVLQNELLRLSRLKKRNNGRNLH